MSEIYFEKTRYFGTGNKQRRSVITENLVGLLRNSIKHEPKLSLDEAKIKLRDSAGAYILSSIVQEPQASLKYHATAQLLEDNPGSILVTMTRQPDSYGVVNGTRVTEITIPEEGEITFADDGEPVTYAELGKVMRLINAATALDAAIPGKENL